MFQQKWHVSLNIFKPECLNCRSNISIFSPFIDNNLMYILYFEITCILKVTNIITRGPLKDFDKFTCEGFFLNVYLENSLRQFIILNYRQFLTLSQFSSRLRVNEI